MRQKMKQGKPAMRLRILSGVLVSALAVTACGSSTDADSTGTTSQPESESSQSEPVTITYSYWDQNFTPYVEEVIAAFNEIEPNITVEIQVVPFDEYWNKMQAAAAGGEVPDVLWMNVPNYPTYAANGTIANLDDRIASDGIDMSKYPVNSYVGLADGQHTMPNNFDAMGLWYNTELFDEAGLDYPDPSWTWDDLKAAAETLTSDGVYGFVAHIEEYMGWWNFIYQNGASVVSADGATVGFDNENGCSAIDFYTSFVREGLSPDGPTLASSDDPTAIFLGGRAAMMILGSWMIAPMSTEDGFNVTALPAGSVATSMTHNMSNAMSGNTEHADAAWKFLKFLSSEEGITIQAKNGNNIPDYEGVEQVWLDAYPELNLDEVYTQVGNQSDWPPNSNEYQQAMHEVWRDTYNGNLPWEDLCANAAAAGNAALAGN